MKSPNKPGSQVGGWPETESESESESQSESESKSEPEPQPELPQSAFTQSQGTRVETTTTTTTRKRKKQHQQHLTGWFDGSGSHKIVKTRNCKLDCDAVGCTVYTVYPKHEFNTA